jgi:glycerol-3-phosphate cytidylyltransferase
MKRIITFGTFDLFHIGHLKILERAKKEGDYLIVGVSSDELNIQKGKKSVISLNERIEIIKSIKYVDEVFVEEKLELKDVYIKQFKADLLIMGDDWKDKFNWVSCPVKYLDRTPDVSTTDLKNNIAVNYNK